MKNAVLIIAIFWTLGAILWTLNISEQVALLKIGGLRIGLNNDFKAILIRYSIILPWLLLMLVKWKEKK